MENSTILKSNKWRISILIFSPLFLLTTGYFILNQQNIIVSIFNNYFSLTFTNVLRLLATDNWLEVLLHNAKNMVINIGVVLLIEILVAVIALIVIFYLLYKIRKSEAFFLGNKLVFSGYLLITIGMSIIGMIAISSTIITFITVQGIIDGLKPSELQTISEEISRVLANSSLSSNQLFKDLASILDQIEIVIARAGELASIPGTIDSWWQGILSLKIYVIGVASIGVLSILIGHVMEIWAFIKGSNLYQNYKMKNRKESFNERLLRVLEKQNEILEEMNKKTNTPVNRNGLHD